jgi:hypothetical protein
MRYKETLNTLGSKGIRGGKTRQPLSTHALHEGF